jgi:hypothetical protein
VSLRLAATLRAVQEVARTIALQIHVLNAGTMMEDS